MKKQSKKYNRNIDWVKIERLYRAGLMSICAIARQFDTAEATIRAKALKEGWKRDLTSEVKQLTRTKMVENLAQVFQTEDIKEMADEQLIEEAARTQVEVVRQHQSTLKRGHSLTMRMLDELDATTAYKGELQELISSTIAPQRQEGLRRAVSLAGRATILRELANAARQWVILERQAFGISDERAEKEKNVEIEKLSTDELRAEIIKDAKRMNIDLSEEDLDRASGIAPKVH